MFVCSVLVEGDQFFFPAANCFTVCSSNNIYFDFTDQVLEDAAVHGAAVLGVPVKATIKEVIVYIVQMIVNLILQIALTNFICATATQFCLLNLMLTLLLCNYHPHNSILDGVYDIHFHPYSLQANSDSFVVKTLDRKTLWEMQTPQVIILLTLQCILCFFFFPCSCTQECFAFSLFSIHF